jgi:hypothetical protein
MKEYTAIIKEGDFQWEEVHKIPDNLDPEETIRINVDRFNRFNRRSYIFVKLVRKRKGSSKQVHEWKKVSLVTEKGGFDKMKCCICGATGKRYGLGQNIVTVDSKYDRTYCTFKK